MTTLRFDFQRDRARVALVLLRGPVLNVGCNEDPAHLKALDADRIVNCDLFDWDETMNRPNAADVLFDCARDTWPFADRSCALVILGDILEHLKPAEITHALSQARRVSRRLCITVPCDTRSTNSDEQADRFPRGAVHRTIVTKPMLREQLERTGWTVMEWRTVDYGFCPTGFFLEAE